MRTRCFFRFFLWVETWLLVGGAWGVLRSAEEPANGESKPLRLEDLSSQLEQFLESPRFVGAEWGIKVVSLETKRIVFEHQSTKLLKPASNAKLFTGALALDQFGPEETLQTSVYAEKAPSESGVISGPLLIYGRGDPSMASRFSDGDYSRSFEAAIQAIRAAGIRRIEGGLIGDESFFSGPRTGSGWTWDDLQYYYGAEASALTWQDNVVDLEIAPGATPGKPCSFEARPKVAYLKFENWIRTAPPGPVSAVQVYRPLAEQTVFLFGQLPQGASNWIDSVSAPNPALWFVTGLRDALLKAGVGVGGPLVVRDRLGAAGEKEPKLWKELAAWQSRPMAEIVAKMLKPSQNLYAQLLMLQAGARAEQKSTEQWGTPNAKYTKELRPTTEELGLAELKEFLIEAGIPPGEVLLEEGSGLSRSALVTPNALVLLLCHMHQHPHAAAYRAALPMAGVDGTLRRRLTGLPIQAKTGSLRYVSALSGYLRTRAGEDLVFSLLLNNYNPPPGASGRADIDWVAKKLSELSERTGDRLP